MNDAALKSDTQDIVVDEVFPHAPETIWKTLTTGELIARWLLMPTTGFEPVKGKRSNQTLQDGAGWNGARRFTFKTTPAGAWDGVIHCQPGDEQRRLAVLIRRSPDRRAEPSSPVNTLRGETEQISSRGNSP